MNEVNLTNEFDAEDIQKGKVMSILAYFGILFFLPLVVCPDSKFGRFHANQGLLLLITGFVLGIVNFILTLILVFVSPTLASIIGWIISLVTFVLWLYGIINTAKGQAKELPVIGKFRIIK